MATGESFYLDPTFWVAGSFVAFVGVIVVKGGVQKIGALLDAKAQKISVQLDEARALRDDAELLLTEYQRRQRDVEKESAEIIARAEEDGKLLVSEAKKELVLLSQRRTRSAEDKIAQAELMAVKSVRSAAVDVAIEAARSVLSDALKQGNGNELLDASIKDVDSRLH